jgi:hypothetical protein
MANDMLAWREPANLGEVKRAMDIERELVRPLPLDSRTPLEAHPLGRELTLTGCNQFAAIRDATTRTGRH